MRRGTTPTLTFVCPFSVTNATKVSVVLAQDGSIVIARDKTGVTIDNKKILVHLTENETLGLKSGKKLEMQIRLELGGEKLASNIMHTDVEKILRDGTL